MKLTIFIMIFLSISTALIAKNIQISFWQNGFDSIAPILWANGGRLISEDGRKVNLTSDEMIQ